MHTFSIVTFDPGVINAAIPGYAADDGTPGTIIGFGHNSGKPFSSIRTFPEEQRSTSTVAPNNLSMFSV